jgi:predicted nuclease with TOPRIM domain
MSSHDNNLISFIAATVETMREQMATKEDLVRVESRLETMREQMATKEDLVRVESRLETMRERMDSMEGQMATVKDQMATKDDLSRLATTVRGDFEQVHFRFDTLERVMTTRFGQVETDISRLRSVLYLLVKDQPDMLRLLGQATPGESRPQG